MTRFLLLLALLLAAPAAGRAQTGWTLVGSYPHDRTAFTEGLLVHDGLLYESTGLEGHSTICARRLETNAAVRCTKVPAKYFGEGIVIWRNRLISLTWQHGEGLIWSLPKLKKIGSFRYPGEGWALTHDGKRLIMSDGTAQLRFLDPESLRESGRINVSWRGKPITNLNELEYVDGEILANVWMTPYIARIDPADGHVIDWIDLTPLLKRLNPADPDDVLNGIAWDAKARRLFVTGKRWPTLFEIRLNR